jgi:hypothetical protein
MKKLLVLMLVLGVASTASAMTLTLSADLAAGTVDVDDSTGYVVGDDLYFAVVGDTGAITVTGGALTGIAPGDSAIFGDDAQLNGMCAAPLDGMWGSLASIAGTATGPGTYVENIAWSLVGGAADITLIGTSDFMTFTVLDVINVPEPMTIALLGLGSLFLLRRRK